MFCLSGFFSISVTDHNYPDQSLFIYDVGVKSSIIYEYARENSFAVSTKEICQKFKLDFSIPTGEPVINDKRYRVEISDTFRTINMIVFRPGNTRITKEVQGL